MEAVTLFLAIISGLAYFYTWVLKLPKGYPRLIAILPIFPFFLLLPWHTSVNSLKVLVAFVSLWICPSKLILLCWDCSIDHRPWILSSFPHFAVAMLLPIRILGPKKKKTEKVEMEKKKKDRSFRVFLSPSGDLNLPTSFLFMVLIHNVYRLGECIPRPIINLTYSFHLYLVEILLLGSISAIVSILMNVEVDLCFDNPYLSSSVGDFWGNRWNRVVPTLLRATVSDPILRRLTPAAAAANPIQPREEQKAATSPACEDHSNGLMHANVPSSSCIEREEQEKHPLIMSVNPAAANSEPKEYNHSYQKLVENKENPIGPRPRPSIWVRMTAIMASFLVSGLFHELLFFSLHKSFIFGDFLLFFLLHGMATSLETALRRALPKHLRLSFLASWLTSFLFIYATSSWLFFPAINKTTLFTDSIHEYFVIERFVLSFIPFIKPQA